MRFATTAACALILRCLTTSTFDILKSNPKLGRAEALRRAMLAYMNDTTDPLSAYPALWAPFVVVGEGAGQPVAAMRYVIPAYVG